MLGSGMLCLGAPAAIISAAMELYHGESKRNAMIAMGVAILALAGGWIFNASVCRS